MRSFIAIHIDEALRRRVANTRRALERADADVRWVKDDALHLTLKFLGDIAEPEAARLAERLRLEAQRFPPFELDFAGVGRFPKGGSPKVLWIGCRGDVSKLVGLAQAVERAALEIGVPREEHPFSPHLTIGRVRSPRNLQRLKNALEARFDDVIGVQRADRFTLYRSTLTSDGPIHEEIEGFTLGG